MSRSKSKSRYKNVECHYCHKTGIYRNTVSCGKRKIKAKRDDDDDDDDDRVTAAIGDDLIIDSGATLHVTPRKEFFTSYTSGDFVVLRMDNDGVTKVIGVGDVCLQTNTGIQLWLKGVKHALDIRFNMIFVHMLDDDYDNHFGYGK
ncbi:hypothetical protein CR513_19314, partial [Mucuna pruriens]